MTRARFSMIAVCTLALGACKTTTEAGAPAPEAADSTAAAPAKTEAPEAAPAAPASAATAAAVEPKGPKVVLLSPGTGPTRALRLSPKVGQKQTMVMTMDMDIEMSMNGQVLPTGAAPATELTMVTTVTEASEARIHYEFEFTDVLVHGGDRVPEAQVEAVRAGLEGIKGIKGWGEVDRTGRTLAADFETGPDLPPALKRTLDSMRQSLTQLSAPLPVEPVGVGARWRVTTNLEGMGFPLAQDATYELQKLTEHGGFAVITLEQRATGSEVNLPNMPPEAKATLVALDGKGRGEVDFDLQKMAPRSASTELDSRTETEIAVQGKAMRMVMQMKMSMGLRGL